MRIPLINLIEETLNDPNSKSITGEARNTTELVRNIPNLYQSYPLPFLFFAFEPKIDKNVISYVEDPAIEADAGSDILCIYMKGSIVECTLDANENFTLRDSTVPAYDYVRQEFPNPEKLTFPGILILGGEECGESAFIPICPSKTAQELRQDTQTIMQCIRESRRSNKGFSTSEFYLRLKNKNIQFHRSSTSSPAEIIGHIWLYCMKNGRALLAIISNFI